MIPIQRLADLDPLARRTLLTRPGVVTTDLLTAVRTIVEDVRDHGDSALRAYSEKFDQVKLDTAEVRPEEMAAAKAALTPAQIAAIEEAHANITKFHRLQKTGDYETEVGSGVRMGRRMVPFRRAGIYVPGGLAVYPTCVLMNAIPAREAGVSEIILCTPPGPDGSVHPAVRYSALLSGVQRLFRIGGAQAIAAMAYGTATVPRCEIIVGPGNRFVTAAKKIVAADVAIDFLAGPTELLVLSDGSGRAAYIAADLISQAEHDPSTCLTLVTTNRAQAEAVDKELDVQMPRRERRDIVKTALTRHGALLVADSLDQAVEFTNDYGPEHLSIFTADPASVFRRIRHAGAVFLGETTPVASGDYGSGPNSTLPTLGEARRAGGLGISNFQKALTWLQLSPEGVGKLAPMQSELARLEGLEGHAAAIEIRREPHGA